MEQILGSEARLVFIGKLDDWETLRLGIPAGMEGISLPLAPPNPSCLGTTLGLHCRDDPALQGNPVRPADDLATIVFT